MIDYATWWITAIALSSITLGYWLIIKLPLGVSGSWARIVLWKREALITKADKPFQSKPNTMVDALMAATLEAFGEDAVQEVLSKHKGKIPGLETISHCKTIPKRLPWTSHLLFLLMLPIGGLITSIAMGTFNLQFNLGELHSNLFGSGFSYVLTLVIGGILIGFGTQLSGGCTTGHGLSGVSRLIPVSLVATCSFFGAAVITSLLIHFTAG